MPWILLASIILIFPSEVPFAATITPYTLSLTTIANSRKLARIAGMAMSWMRMDDLMLGCMVILVCLLMYFLKIIEI
jgi:hypothetical protein